MHQWCKWFTQKLSRIIAKKLRELGRYVSECAFPRKRKNVVTRLFHQPTKFRFTLSQRNLRSLIVCNVFVGAQQSNDFSGIITEWRLTGSQPDHGAVFSDLGFFVVNARKIVLNHGGIISTIKGR